MIIVTTIAAFCCFRTIYRCNGPTSGQTRCHAALRRQNTDACVEKRNLQQAESDLPRMRNGHFLCRRKVDLGSKVYLDWSLNPNICEPDRTKINSTNDRPHRQTVHRSTCRAVQVLHAAKKNSCVKRPKSPSASPFALMILTSILISLCCIC